MRTLVILLLALTGCLMFRPDPLEEGRGALVLVFDTRTAGDLKALRRILAHYGARATFFAAGQIGRERALAFKDLKSEGHEIGFSGLNGVNPQSYSRMYGAQKYFQDEIVTQVLAAKRYGVHPCYYLLDTLSHAKSETLSLPLFLISKGFVRVVHRLPKDLPPRAKPAAELTAPVVHAYLMTPDNFDRAQMAALARNNAILIVQPNLEVLPDLLEAAKEQGVAFATVADLKLTK